MNELDELTKLAPGAIVIPESSQAA
ncbi:MAG: hypothetical protein RLZZ378_702, partial [Actinomycetota bacterium]